MPGPNGAASRPGHVFPKSFTVEYYVRAAISGQQTMKFPTPRYPKELYFRIAHIGIIHFATIIRIPSW
jgi:hypothetical protein